MPVYEPTVVYGDWWYPSYPPYYWPYPGASFVNGFFWGAGIAIAGNIWGWGHWDWSHRNIDVDVNKWNNINVNRQHITSNKWEHNAAHRGPVPLQEQRASRQVQASGSPAGGEQGFPRLRQGRYRSLEDRVQAQGCRSRQHQGQGSEGCGPEHQEQSRQHRQGQPRRQESLGKAVRTGCIRREARLGRSTIFRPRQSQPGVHVVRRRAPRWRWRRRSRGVAGGGRRR